MNKKLFSTHNLILGLLLLALPVLVVIVEQQTHLFSKADSSTAPQQILISNISDSSFSVSWVTAKATSGFVQFGTTAQFDNSLQDDRQDGIKERHTHFVTMKNLHPDTLYYYKITSGSESYDNKGKPYQQKTAPVLTTTPSVTTPIFGRVYAANNQLPKEAIVYLLPKNGTTLATPIDKGGWILTVDNSRTLDLQNSLKFKSLDHIDAFVEGGVDGTAEVTLVLDSQAPQQPIVLNNTKQSIAGSEASPAAKVADLNHDGKINAIDYALAALKKLKK